MTIEKPNPFTVFVGPNGSGKSNIFEALEFLNFLSKFIYVSEVSNLFGGVGKYLNFNKKNNKLGFNCKFEQNENNFNYELIDGNLFLGEGFPFPHKIQDSLELNDTYKQFFVNFSRIFIKNSDKQRVNTTSNSKLNFSCNNLEIVLKNTLKGLSKKEELQQWLELFIPGFESIEITSTELSSTDTLIMYEKGTNKPFTKDLLSDGTYNNLALLTAVFQSDEPQFLCIEEPENGLHPKVIKELVHLFREACEEKGHYIWLNTHSQTLVSQLKPEEIILVNKKEGDTIIKQLTNFDLHGLKMDEAWLSAALGGGLPW